MIKRCFLDVETTGLTPKHGIVQLAAILEIGDDVHEFQVECQPFDGDVIDDEALAIHGRTREQIAAYVGPHGAHSLFCEFLGRHVDKYNRSDKAFFYAFNASFDSQMLRAWFAKAGDNYFGSWFWVPAIDVMTLAGEQLVEKRSTMPNFKLTTVCETVGIALDAAHDALADVRATRELYGWCRRKA